MPFLLICGWFNSTCEPINVRSTAEWKGEESATIMEQENSPSTYDLSVFLTHTHTHTHTHAYIYIYIYIYMSFVCIYLPNPSATPRMWQKVKFLSRVSALIFICSWRSNREIHVFPKGMSGRWNVNSFIQDLKSNHRFHFPKAITVTLIAPPSTRFVFGCECAFLNFVSILSKDIYS